jgi:predicted nucleic acid-binding protein
VSLLVDTSVWSLVLRRDGDPDRPEALALRAALERSDAIYVTGLILQEILQGFAGPKTRDRIIEHFAPLPCLVPERRDHVEAADLRNRCRRAGIQVGTIDALLAQLCIRHGLTMLTTDDDFRRVAGHEKLSVWKSSAAGN